MNEMQFANAVCAAHNMNQSPPKAISTPADAPAVVEIADVHPEASKITVRELRAGMAVWDIWGNAYTLDKVTHFKHGCRLYRSDGEVEWFDYLDALDEGEQTFTVGLPG